MPLAALCALTVEMGRSSVRPNASPESCLIRLPKLSVVGVGSCADTRAKDPGREWEAGRERDEPLREWRGGVRVYESSLRATGCEPAGAPMNDMRLNQLIRPRLARRSRPRTFGVATLVLGPGFPSCPTLTRRAVRSSAPSGSWKSVSPDFSDMMDRALSVAFDFSDPRDARRPPSSRLSKGGGGRRGEPWSSDGRRSTILMLGYGGASPISSSKRIWTSRGMMCPPGLGTE